MITVIILIILASISISLALGDDGIITKAIQGKENMKIATDEEQETLQTLLNQINGDNQTTIPTEDETDVNEIEEEEIPIKTTFTISYNLNGGKETIENQTKTRGENLILSDVIPTKDGYKFGGWATSADGEAIYDPGDSYSLEQDITLYAVWIDPIIVSEISTGLSTVTLRGSVRVPVSQSNVLKLSKNNTYMVECDYVCKSGTNRFDIDFYPDSLPETHPIATTTKQHLRWIVKFTNDNCSSCRLRIFDDLYDSKIDPAETDITVSNIKLYVIIWPE